MPIPLRRPCLLVILDGWGIRPDPRYNAVAMARTPFIDHALSTYPHTRLLCAGEAVGLPPGIMGNSEVGHLNIGAGRVVYQDLLRINNAIADKTFFDNRHFTDVIQQVKAGQTTLHLLGLVSDGGVHSHFDHLIALLELARRKSVPDTQVHVILDGRDTPPRSGEGFVRRLQAHMDAAGYGRIATICGRYYAMDRDNRWDRVERAYRLYTAGEGRTETHAVAAVKRAYQGGETDEFVKPIVVTDTPGEHRTTAMGHGDGVIFFNFRADRAREITRALTAGKFDAFPRPLIPRICRYVCMTLYDQSFSLPVAFPQIQLEGILAEVISSQGLKQLRIAETEKYAHVTYFFNGGRETPFPGEERHLVPSPRDVATYDLKPEMSARAVTAETIARLQTQRYDFVVLNFANMDMVGHTGVLQAAITACETVDRCLGEIVSQINALGGVTFITADHGNSETMADENGDPHTAHTLNPVHFVLADDSRPQVSLRHQGILGDIAPTILDVMGITAPPQMTGRTLIAGLEG